MAKVLDAAPRFASEFPDALHRFWNGAYPIGAVEELDDLEERGAERFLTWFIFDYAGEGGRTPLQRLVDDAASLELTPVEAQVLPGWLAVRLQPYTVREVRKGRGLTVSPLWEEREIAVEDHAAARRVAEAEVLIAHLTPTGGTHFVAGAAAQLTTDTIERLHEWTDLHLEDLHTYQPAAGYPELIQDRSQIFNHFVMALPRELQPVNPLQTLIDNTRVIMAQRRNLWG